MAKMLAIVNKYPWTKLAVIISGANMRQYFPRGNVFSVISFTKDFCNRHVESNNILLGTVAHISFRSLRLCGDQALNMQR